MFISRLKSLIGGKFSRWLKAREAHDPEAVYEAARHWLDKRRSVTGYLVKDTHPEEKRS